MPNTLPRALGAVLVLGAFIAGVFLLIYQPPQRERGSLVLGAADAPVVLTEFADFR